MRGSPGHLNTGDEHEIAAFYEAAFRDWIADPRVVAVTPLFWHPDRGVYWMFDFDQDSKVVDESPTYELIQRLPRLKGSPLYEPEIENVARGEPQPALAKVENLALRPDPAGSGGVQAAAQAGPSEAEPASEEPTATPTPVPPTATPIPETATPVLPTATRFMRIGNTDGGAVRLRGTPARAAASIASVPPGTRVEALGSSERYQDLYWQRVRTPDGTVGWIAIDFLIPE